VRLRRDTTRRPRAGQYPEDVERPLLVAEDLVTTFSTPRGELTAVDGVSLRLERGRTLGVVGESGSGKTVLTRSIMGLLPRRGVRTSGTVWFNGRQISGLSPSQRRAIWGVEMAVVFQDPMTSLNPTMKIGRQITESLRYHLSMTSAEADAQAVELLGQVGISTPERRLHEYPHQLSGGLRQRVTIAIALACGPRLLFADEPTTALDVTVQAQILDLLADLQRERAMAMILVSHDLGVVAGRTDEIAVMYGGQVVEVGPTRALFSDVKMPYTEALLRSSPRADRPSHTPLEVIPGRPPDLVDPPPGCRFAPRCSYARVRCALEAPPLVEAATPGHRYACWYPVGTPVAPSVASANGRPPVPERVVGEVAP